MLARSARDRVPDAPDASGGGGSGVRAAGARHPRDHLGGGALSRRQRDVAHRHEWTPPDRPNARPGSLRHSLSWLSSEWSASAPQRACHANQPALETSGECGESSHGRGRAVLLHRAIRIYRGGHGALVPVASVLRPPQTLSMPRQHLVTRLPACTFRTVGEDDDRTANAAPADRARPCVPSSASGPVDPPKC